MKRNGYFLVIFFCFFINSFLTPICLFAKDDDAPEGKRIKNRKFEIGLINVKVGFANDFMSAKDILQEKMIVDIDGLKDGLGINFDVNAYPIFFNYNKNDIWGFGLSLGVQAFGNINLSGKMLSFSEAIDEKSDVKAAVSAEARYNRFFHAGKIKIKVRPALYFPLAYANPDISYTFNNTTDGTILNLGYKLRLFTAFPLEGGFSKENFKLTTYPGIDFILGAEYPLSEILGLKRKHSSMDFKLGLDLINLPAVPAFMNDYMEISGRMGNSDPINLFEGGLDGFSFKNEDTVYGRQRISVLRPFKMITWADWRPFKPINIISSFGFVLDPFYSRLFSPEGGVKMRLDLLNLFILSFGVGYYDHLWKNSLDLALNFRAFELDIGVELRSQSFAKSWTGAGFAVEFGIKFGW